MGIENAALILGIIVAILTLAVALPGAILSTQALLSTKARSRQEDKAIVISHVIVLRAQKVAEKAPFVIEGEVLRDEQPKAGNKSSVQKILNRQQPVECRPPDGVVPSSGKLEAFQLLRRIEDSESD